MFVTNEIELNNAKATVLYKPQQKETEIIYTDIPLGAFVKNGRTHFRLYAPRAVKVILCLSELPDSEFRQTDMNRISNGVWEIVLEGELFDRFYGYKVYNKNQDQNSERPVCLDPYAKAVATKIGYMAPKYSVLTRDEYDWENDSWIQNDWRDLIIYEAHIKDMTAHGSSGSQNPGTYKGFIEKEITGGINHIRSLGVNCVEILPSMEFSYIELPYKKELNKRYNTWNPYERNHWGYMTTAFFAPTAFYSSDRGNLQVGEWAGTSGRQVIEFKDMIKGFHKEGIAVIMDVVYNHLSEYEIANLKEIDNTYYFRKNENGTFSNESGCANDIKTENPMVRRLIIDSILYWMKEYHIDGFRFDLGHLIDWETIEEIIYEAKKINPHVVFVCEPWGGGYDPKGFSVRGCGSWNDQIRNGIKGENPYNGKGWIFENWYGNNNSYRIKSYVRGTLNRDHGLFTKKEHSVNYLESHDGYTLGDFIRIAVGDVNPDMPVTDLESHYKLTEKQLKINKLSAAFLLTSQGMVMIHAGQEFARSKVIAKTEGVSDPKEGFLDHNSYEKDNETNYLNYNHLTQNRELFDYYCGLINLRKTFPAFRHADYNDIIFNDDSHNGFALGYELKYENDNFVVLFNASHLITSDYDLPEGDWEVFTDPESAFPEIRRTISGKVTLPPVSAFVLKRK